MQFATNHLGHFLLTNLLLPNLIQTASKRGAPEGRIVNISSSAHFASYKGGILQEDELNSEAHYHDWHAYGQSKLCNLLHARELDARLGQDPKANVVAIAVHPGVIATDLQKHLLNNSAATRGVRKTIGLLASPFLKSIDQGAATTVYACCAPDAQGGEFYCDCNTQESHAYSKSRQLGQRLWDISQKFVSKSS